MQNRDILCVSFPTWEGNYAKTIVEIMSVISENNRVLYVDYQYTFKDVILGIFKNNKVPIKRILGMRPRLRKIKTKYDNEVFVLTPFLILPNNFISKGILYNFFNWYNAKIVAYHIKKSINKLQFKNIITINAFNPIMGVPLYKMLSQKLLLYYCYDEITAADWISKHGGYLEDIFLTKIDAVINTSKGLQQKNESKIKNSFLVKNGVDFDLFHKGYIAPELKTGRKRIGYIGIL